MNQEPQQSSSHRGNRTRHIVLGILFTIGWLYGCAAIGFFVFMIDGFGLSAEGEGPGKPPTQTQNKIFLIIQLVGFVAAAIAGILGGASFYCPSHRKRLLWLFGTLLVAGVLVFISAFVYFFCWALS